MNKYSVIDIETTGGHRSGNRITEIAIINLDGDRVVESFSTLINPERFIPTNITYLTGITNEMVEEAPKFFEVAKKIVEMTEGRIFVAHNVFFDYNFIKYEFNELGYAFKRDKLCTVRLARKSFPGHKSYSLGNICQDLGIEIESRHRALGDAKATVKLFQKIQSLNEVLEPILSEAKKIALPPHLKHEDFENLPHTAGIYYFYNDGQELLYIGKSKDIKKRVQQHFRPNIQRKKDLQLKNSIARIKYKELGSELAALLFECHEIKEKWPTFNISLKSRKFTYGVSLIAAKSGLLYPKMFSAVDASEFIYLYKNKFAAQKKIDSTYQALFGELSLHDTIEKKSQALASKLGIDIFNQMIEKVFFQNMPTTDQFLIELPGPKSTQAFIEVKDKRPYRIKIKDEIILLREDPQMQAILWNYMAKYKLKLHKNSSLDM